MIKLCIFDLDGTLLDTVETIRYNLNRALRDFSLNEVSCEDVKLMIGDGVKNLIRRAAAASGKSDTELLCSLTERFNLYYGESPYELTEAYPGIVELLDKLMERGVKLAVLSNKNDSVVKQLCKTHFGDRITLAVGAREGVALKPDPESALAICRELGIDPRESAYFGDTGHTDMVLAKKYGAALAVGVLWGYRSREDLIENGADVTVSDAASILNYV